MPQHLYTLFTFFLFMSKYIGFFNITKDSDSRYYFSYKVSNGGGAGYLCNHNDEIHVEVLKTINRVNDDKIRITNQNEEDLSDEVGIKPHELSLVVKNLIKQQPNIEFIEENHQEY